MATRRRTVHHCIAMKRCLGVFLHSFRPQGQGGQAPQELQTVQLEPGRQLETVNLGGRRLHRCWDWECYGGVS